MRAVHLQTGATAFVNAEACSHMSDGSDLTGGAPGRPMTPTEEGGRDFGLSAGSPGSEAPEQSSGAIPAQSEAEIAEAARERQFVFDFPAPERSSSSFLVTEANRDAMRLVGAPQLWTPAACVVGPRGSGKTHLAQDYFSEAQLFPATVLQSDASAQSEESGAGLGDAPSRLLEMVGRPNVHVVLDKIDDVFEAENSSAAERALFHIFNRAAERGAKILLLARTPPARWPVALPDLRTRLRTVPVARIEGPDDALLAHLLRKRFGDLGFIIETPTIQYLLTRLPRSFEAVEDAVRRVNEQAWADDQALSIPFVRNALGI